MQNLTLYLNVVNYPFSVDWSSSGQRFGFRNGSLRSVYIPTPDGLTLGAWHILPRQKTPFINPYVGYDAQTNGNEMLKNADKVYLYFHGNAGNRATGHRISFYKVY